MNEPSSTQPYSDRMVEHVVETMGQDPNDCAYALRVLDEAHDRQALGLDASVHARAFLDEIVGTIQVLKEGALRAGDDFSANCYGTVMNVLLREFEANGGRP